MSETRINPRLVVRGAARAIDFYVAGLGAVELERFADPDGVIVNAEIQVGASVFSLTEESLPMNPSPETLGNTPLLLTLVVPDADAVGESMVAAGAEVVIPIADQPYGLKQGRLRDPMGHLWIISQDPDA